MVRRVVGFGQSARLAGTRATRDGGGAHRGDRQRDAGTEPEVAVGRAEQAGSLWAKATSSEPTERLKYAR